MQGANQTLQAAKSAAATYPIDQDPRILKLQSDRGIAALTLKGANDFLSLTQQATDGMIVLAGQTYNGLVQQIVGANAVLQKTNDTLGLVKQGVGELAGVAGYLADHGLGALLDVRSASFDGTLSGTKGGAVILDAAVVFQGTPQAVHLAYDFGDLAEGAKALAKAVVPSFSL